MEDKKKEDGVEDDTYEETPKGRSFSQLETESAAAPVRQLSNLANSTANFIIVAV